MKTLRFSVFRDSMSNQVRYSAKDFFVRLAFENQSVCRRPLESSLTSQFAIDLAFVVAVIFKKSRRVSLDIVYPSLQIPGEQNVPVVQFMARNNKS